MVYVVGLVWYMYKYMVYVVVLVWYMYKYMVYVVVLKKNEGGI